MPLSVLKVLEVLCSKIAIVAALLMALVIFVDVVGRTVFDTPLGFSYEVVSISLAIMFYSGLYHVHKTKGHITIDLLDKFYVGTFGKIIFWFVYLIECVFYTTLVITLFMQVEESYKFGDVFLFLGVMKWKVLLAVSVFALIAWVSLFVSAPKRNSGF
ncbi:TRAP-type C4-dicarboxylate transport system, small permease component [Amphritea atlantica]|uniref:TRAP transporter small permease protein n=2 Tax=Amphritea TaxID=515417 RepID=A0A1H9MF85_9GAMM|nr:MULTISPECIES: TRAP transporter small permease subunit [Amphritea]MBN0989250.1 TRAP transporter small permease subunit [Amphritea pacifica]SER22127.1 TRAP-type C4-dicarboxylate transport system, small permease component [Amphritea atlantica]